MSRVHRHIDDFGLGNLAPNFERFNNPTYAIRRNGQGTGTGQNNNYTGWSRARTSSPPGSDFRGFNITQSTVRINTLMYDTQFYYVVFPNLSIAGDIFPVPSVIAIPIYSTSNSLTFHVQQPVEPNCVCCPPRSLRLLRVTFRAPQDIDNHQFSYFTPSL